MFGKKGIMFGGINYTAGPTVLFLLWLAFSAFTGISSKLVGHTWIASAVAIGLGLGLIFSLLLHEAGHAYTSRYLGLPVNEIELFALGGMAKMTRRPDSAHQEFLIAIAGPIVSLLLWLGLCAPLKLGVDATWAKLIANLGFVNLLIAIFNMVPAFPLDGGRVFRSIMWALLRKPIKATTIAVRVSEVIVVAYVIWNLYEIKIAGFGIIWTLLLAAFIIFAGEMELKALKDEGDDE